jgi:4-hydroxybenzoate polyprenyltransferase
MTAFLSTIIFFLQLRIADEFKDYDDDLAYRPYRPVQRGLVLLSELKRIALAAAAFLFAGVLWINPRLVFPLLLVWAYMLLMAKEFFVHDWLKRRPVIYLVSHMLIMPLIYFYITACDWTFEDAAMPSHLVWLLGMGFFNGIVIEIGRKIRSPQDEEQGVETYSALWGPARATIVWIGALLVTMFFTLMASSKIDLRVPIAWLLTAAILAALTVAVRFLHNAVHGSGKQIELISGIWTLLLHLGIGSAFFSTA